jgi:8-oxo-dGTP pyrophosphatase MutT (NUDIX family)
MATQVGTALQAAVIPLLDGRVCLVSSRGGKRWVTPKGNIAPGRSAGEVALMEAWEEAGLVGVLQREPVGSYVYEKDGTVCHVLVFLLRVTKQVDVYPEAAARRREWMTATQALARIEEAGLRELLQAATVE